MMEIAPQAACEVLYGKEAAIASERLMPNSDSHLQKQFRQG